MTSHIECSIAHNAHIHLLDVNNVKCNRTLKQIMVSSKVVCLFEHYATPFVDLRAHKWWGVSLISASFLRNMTRPVTWYGVRLQIWNFLSSLGKKYKIQDVFTETGTFVIMSHVFAFTSQQWSIHRTVKWTPGWTSPQSVSDVRFDGISWNIEFFNQPRLETHLLWISGISFRLA